MKRTHAIALTLIAILLVAVVFAPAPGTTRWMRTLHNSAHAPIFGCVALLVLIALRNHPRWVALTVSRQYLIAIGTAMVLGVATEVAQLFTGRDASFADAFHDVLGAAASLAVFAVFDSRLRAVPGSKVIRAVSIVIAVALLAAIAAPAARAAMKYQRRDQQFPVLADFSRYYDRYFILQRWAELFPVQLPSQWAVRSDERAMRVRFLQGAYPGIEFIEPPPDWSSYRALVLDLINPTAIDLPMVLRIHDAQHDNTFSDRFNKGLVLHARTREAIRIPLSEVAAGPLTRTLDLRHVDGMILFESENAPRDVEIYLSRVWLE
jgi:hypothetical protein